MYKILVLPLAGPILDSEGIGAFLGGIFYGKKGILVASTPTKSKMPFVFLNISDKNIFIKTLGNWVQ